MLLLCEQELIPTKWVKLEMFPVDGDNWMLTRIFGIQDPTGKTMTRMSLETENIGHGDYKTVDKILAQWIEHYEALKYKHVQK